jgi:tetratricopeptide (TPR) repeat protein
MAYRLRNCQWGGRNCTTCRRFHHCWSHYDQAAFSAFPETGECSIADGFINYAEEVDPDDARSVMILEHSKAIMFNPNNDGLYAERGMFYKIKGDYDNAIPDYSKAIKLEAGDENYRQALADARQGKLLSGMKDWERAAAEYAKAVELDPDNAEYYGNRGDAYYKKGDNDRAIADYTMAIELVPFEDFSVIFYRKNLAKAEAAKEGK